MPAPIPLPRRFNGYAPQKTMWWHDAIIDRMLAHPEWTKKDIAKDLNCTHVFIYMITGSDLFQARWEQRRGEYSRNLDDQLLGKAAAVASKTLDRILDIVSDEGKAIPLPQLESLADKTLGRLGYGPRRADAPPTVQVNGAGAVQVIVPATRSELDDARRLIANNERALSTDRGTITASIPSPAPLAEGRMKEEVDRDGTDSFNTESRRR